MRLVVSQLITLSFPQTPPPLYTLRRLALANQHGLENTSFVSKRDVVYVTETGGEITKSQNTPAKCGCLMKRESLPSSHTARLHKTDKHLLNIPA